jgi:phosphatidate cytidylyltransferase
MAPRYVEKMLKHRLVFGILLGLGLVIVVLLDGWVDGSITVDPSDDRPWKGLLFLGLLYGLAIPAHLELGAMLRTKGLHTPIPLVTVASLLLYTTPYWPSCGPLGWGAYICLLLCGTLIALLGFQGLAKGPDGSTAAAGAGILMVVYLGLHGAFVVWMRLHWGVWVLLMYIWVIKGADIGAYALGRRFGRHRLVPLISPDKTWEGLVGAIGLAVLIAVLFAKYCSIMSLWCAVSFGVCFGILGQIGDLVESVLKRDARIKDASNLVPGFGGILDLMDSPLIPAPWACLFLMGVGTGIG